MALKDLLLNPDSFNVGLHTSPEWTGGLTYNTTIQHGGPSKSIKYGANSGGRFGEKDIPRYHLTPRVVWFGDDDDGDAGPTFKFGNDHSNSVLDGGSLRAGMQIFEDRRELDLKRINRFLGSEQGNAFKRRQVALQILNNHANPGQRVFNLGVNLKAQVLASGLSHIKRAGALPIPALEEGFNKAESGLGMILAADYISYQKKKSYLREEQYSLGDPGARPAGNSKALNLLVGNVEDGPKRRREYAAPYDERENLIDKINVTKVFKAIDGVEDKFLHKDFIKFKFEVVDSDSPKDTHHIIFRAFLDSFGDALSATHNEIKYNGRGENFYTYQKFNRSISISFKVATQTRYEMKPLYQKLNYLAAQTAPNYSSTGRIRTPYMRITVGDYLSRVPGIINSINIDWHKDYPWEIVADPNGKDANMKQLPHVLDVTLQFTPIHGFTPSNDINAPFIGIGNQESVGNLKDFPVSGSWLGLGETTDSKGEPYKYTDYQFNVSIKHMGGRLEQSTFDAADPSNTE